MRVKIAIAASVILLATADSRAEDNKACILKATATVPRISGLVIKKNTDPSCSSSDLGNLARPDPTDNRGCGYGRSGRRRNLFVHVCDDEGVGVRAQGDELVSRLLTGEYSSVTEDEEHVPLVGQQVCFRATADLVVLFGRNSR